MCTWKPMISRIPGTGVDSLTGFEGLLPLAGTSGSPVLSASTIKFTLLTIPGSTIKYSVKLLLIQFLYNY